MKNGKRNVFWEYKIKRLWGVGSLEESWGKCDILRWQLLHEWEKTCSEGLSLLKQKILISSCNTKLIVLRGMLSFRFSEKSKTI